MYTIWILLNKELRMKILLKQAQTHKKLNYGRHPIAPLLRTPRSAHTILNQYTKTTSKSPKHDDFVVPISSWVFSGRFLLALAQKTAIWLISLVTFILPFFFGEEKLVAP
jgi:hypothetical protein